MNSITTLDIVIFFGSLSAVMGLGLLVGRKENSTEDYFLAGRETRWWGVAGSIFGSNISANHIVGMMAVGFSLGFVESHFEITAIAGLLMMCYFFLPVYRKLNVYTLSDYLSKRYDDRCRIAYSIIMVSIIVFVMMVPAFYIGSRSVNILLVEDSHIQQVLASASSEKPQKITINHNYYSIGILVMALVTGSYVILGGLKAVIITDVIQSLLMLIGASIVAYLTFRSPEIGGWEGMRELDREGKDLMHLYLPSDHPKRPWTGVLSGLLILHFYYWGTNQFIVQRALAAKTDREARIGIIGAGFFKLLIPFISIGTGIAAYYLFSDRMPGVVVDGDTAFPLLMREVVAKAGAGLVGLVAAGLIGAILSSVDSMMNSAATLITFDIYKKYVKPDASEDELIRMGRWCIAGLVTGSAVLTILIMDPNTEDNFFTYVASHQSKLVGGLVVAFFIGMVWKGATAAGGLAAIISGVAFSYLLPPIYSATIGKSPMFISIFGENLNFFHSVFLAAILAAIVHLLVSKSTQPDEEKAKLTWTGLDVFTPAQLAVFGKTLLISLGIYGLLGALVALDTMVTPVIAAWIGAAWTFLCFFLSARLKASESGEPVYKEDRFWAGGLASCAIFMMYYFF